MAADHWPIKKGEASPQAGQCMTAERATLIGRMAAECPVLIEIEKRHLSRFKDIDVALCEKKSTIDTEAFDDKLAVLNAHIEDLTSWKREPALWFAAGLVATVAAVILARETVIDRSP